MMLATVSLSEASSCLIHQWKHWKVVELEAMGCCLPHWQNHCPSSYPKLVAEMGMGGGRASVSRYVWPGRLVLG